MNTCDQFILPHILSLKPYTSARDEFSGAAEVYLDANENGLGAPVHSRFSPRLNRYPDPYHSELRSVIGSVKNVTPDRIFIGNGSDEAIDLVLRMCCYPGRDRILTVQPTYGMYEVSASIQDIQVDRIPLPASFELDAAALLQAVQPNTKIIFLCSPNNPTGNVFDSKQIERVVQEFPGVVVLDEAYIDFCQEHSFLSQLEKYKNVIVLQTLSKAWGLAGVRLGMAFANPEIISTFYKIKPPYNISALNQKTASAALLKPQFLRTTVETICKEKARVAQELAQSDEVVRVYPSNANFLLVKFKEAQRMFKMFLDNSIVVRNRHTTYGCENCLRISLGTPLENDRLLRLITGRNASEASSITARRSQHHRKTNETCIKIDVDLDGPPSAAIWTRIGFLDHMLELFAFHAGISLAVHAEGDLEVDVHHTVEDVALTLGQALSEALSSSPGYARYGFTLPMDEARASATLDLSGRPYIGWNAQFHAPILGEMPTSLFEHFFRSLSQSLKATIQIEATGEDDHHLIEAIFKAFARSFRQAVQPTSMLASTKGVL